MSFGAPELSKNDSLVLSQIFDPLLPSSLSTTPLIDTDLITTLPYIPPDLLPVLQSVEVSALAPLDIPSPSPHLLQRTIDELTELIISCPDYPSAYNNRAQALRLLHGDNIYNACVRGSTMWHDLCTVIKLASPREQSESVCVLQGQILGSAYVQRGYLTWKAANTGDKRAEDAEFLLRELSMSMSGPLGTLMESARSDLEMAGRYGYEEARKLVVSANPYARLCGNVVEEALRAEIKKMSR